MTRALYISYDGLLEPLGESQVVTYVERLAKAAHMSVLSFEKPQDLADPHRLMTMRERLSRQGIEWVPLRYHKHPPLLSTGCDVLAGIVKGMHLSREHAVQLVHARGYVAALIGFTLKKLFGVRFLFDMRGFWADEKVDAGHWTSSSIVYRVTKAWERRFFESADGIVSLTEAGVSALPSLGYKIPEHVPIEVIPTCTDLERFTPGPKDSALASQLGLNGFFILGCAGTISNWYLRAQMLGGLAHLLRHMDRAKVLIITRDDHEALRRDARTAGIREEQLVLVRAEFSAMPDYLRLIDLGVFFIKVCFSKKASAATKLGEFLATGVPVVINDGIGDSGRIVRRHHVGVVLPEAVPEAIDIQIQDIRRLLGDPVVRARCRQTAERYFDVRAGVGKYMALYEKLLAQTAVAVV